jgi:tetratricopeptide (TPR) repeat protein
MARRQTTKLLFIIGVIICAVLPGCSKDSSPSGSDQKLTDAEYLAQGWSDFDAKRYDSAINNFTQVYVQTSSLQVRADALNGRGWSYLNKRDLARSSGDFVFANGIAGITPAALLDVRAGAACTLYSMNDFSSAITYSGAVLADSPTFTFSHDPKVTAKRLRLLLAQSYFATGQFALTSAQLDILDPARSPHSSEPAALLASITSVLNSL